MKTIGPMFVQQQAEVAKAAQQVAAEAVPSTGVVNLPT